jgi:calpain family cysteine protease
MWDKTNQSQASMNLEELESRQMFSAAPVFAPSPQIPLTAPAAVVAKNTGVGVAPLLMVHYSPPTGQLSLLPKTTLPALGTTGLQYVNFSNDPLFSPSGPQETDVVQGDLGDCYFLATLASIARTDPNAIRNDITSEGSGVYDVKFYNNGKQVNEYVDSELPVYDGTSSLAYAKLGQDNSTWVAIMEKAFAVFRNGADNYAAIGTGGWMTEVYNDLGFANSSNAVNPLNLAGDLGTIETDLAQGLSVTVATVQWFSSNIPLITDHAYSVDSVYYSSAQHEYYVEMRNPWGFVGAGGLAANNGYVSIPETDLSCFVVIDSARV